MQQPGANSPNRPGTLFLENFFSINTCSDLEHFYKKKKEKIAVNFFIF